MFVAQDLKDGKEYALKVCTQFNMYDYFNKIERSLRLGLECNVQLCDFREYIMSYKMSDINVL